VAEARSPRLTAPLGPPPRHAGFGAVLAAAPAQGPGPPRARPEQPAWPCFGVRAPCRDKTPGAALIAHKICRPTRRFGETLILHPAAEGRGGLWGQTANREGNTSPSPPIPAPTRCPSPAAGRAVSPRPCTGTPLPLGRRAGFCLPLAEGLR